MKTTEELTYKYIKWMAKADAALSRKEAIKCIHKATKIREQLDAQLSTC